MFIYTLQRCEKVTTVYNDELQTQSTNLKCYDVFILLVLSALKQVHKELSFLIQVLWADNSCYILYNYHQRNLLHNQMEL